MKTPTKVKGRLNADPAAKLQSLQKARENYEIYGELGERIYAAVMSYKMGEALSTTYRRRQQQDIDLIGRIWIQRGKRLLKKVEIARLLARKNEEEMDEETKALVEQEKLYVITETDLLRLENLQKKLNEFVQAKASPTWTQTADARNILDSIIEGATPIELEQSEEADD